MGKSPFKEDRKLIAIAEDGATVDSAARSLGMSVQSIRKKQAGWEFRSEMDISASGIQSAWPRSG